MQVKINKVTRKPVETVYGSKTRLAFKTDKHENRWVSGFDTQSTKDWQDGDSVEIEVYDSSDGKFLNFSVPKLEEEDLLKHVLETKKMVAEILDRVMRPQSPEEIDVSDEEPPFPNDSPL